MCQIRQQKPEHCVVFIGWYINLENYLCFCCMVVGRSGETICVDLCSIDLFVEELFRGYLIVYAYRIRIE